MKAKAKPMKKPLKAGRPHGRTGTARPLPKTEYLSISQVAARLGVSRGTIQAEIDDGKLEATLVRNVYRIKDEWFQAYVDGRKVAQSA